MPTKTLTRRINGHTPHNVRNFAEMANCTVEEAPYIMGDPVRGYSNSDTPIAFRIFGRQVFALIGIVGYWYSALIILIYQGNTIGHTFVRASDIAFLEGLMFGVPYGYAMPFGIAILLASLALIFAVFNGDSGKDKLLDEICGPIVMFLGVSTAVITYGLAWFTGGLAVFMLPFAINSGHMEGIFSGPYLATFLISLSFILVMKGSDR